MDAKKLQATPLFDMAPVRKLRDARRAAVATDTTGLETLVHLVPDVPRTRVEDTIADLLHMPDRDLPSILQDYGNALAFRLMMQPGLLRTLGQCGGGRRAAGSARMAVKRRLSKAGLSSRLRRQLVFARVTKVAVKRGAMRRSASAIVKLSARRPRGGTRRR